MLIDSSKMTREELNAVLYDENTERIEKLDLQDRYLTLVHEVNSALNYLTKTKVRSKYVRWAKESLEDVLKDIGCKMEYF